MAKAAQYPQERLDALQEFLLRFRDASDSLSSLRRFFQNFRLLKPSVSEPAPPPAYFPAQSTLAAFFGDFSELYRKLVASGEFANPWIVARLGRSELANEAILVWLLNPQQTHGQGPRFLHELLSITRQKYAAFPISSFPERFQVREEAYLLDDLETRVDILIDGRPEILILIEIKIDAPEGKDQIARNLALAERKADRGTNCVIYLSPQPPQISDPRLFHITWQDVARALLICSRSRRNFSENLAFRYAKHVQQF